MAASTQTGFNRAFGMITSNAISKVTNMIIENTKLVTAIYSDAPDHPHEAGDQHKNSPRSPSHWVNRQNRKVGTNTCMTRRN